MREIVAKRYAKALMEIGKEDNNYEKYGEELKLFSSVLNSSPELMAVMENPIYRKEHKRALCRTICERLSLSPMVTNFLSLLIDKRRIGYLPEIIRCYDKLTDEVAGRVRATVTAAVQLPESFIKRLKERLETMSGKKVVLTIETAPELLGGVVTRIGDQVYDGSLKTQLETIKENLMKG